jgi:glutamate 5-kinase
MTDKHRKIVVKLGTSTLTGGGSRLDQPHVLDIARQTASLRRAGEKICLVSSGAIAAGKEVLDFPQLQKTIPAKQMLAAVGQPRLMDLYQQFFKIYGLAVAQILLTREDISDRKRYLNARNTLGSLLDQNVIPIINENDSVATDEIHIGDNDNLSAMVASLVDADLLILLTDQAGIYTADPSIDKHAQMIEIIDGNEIPTAVWEAAGGSKNGLGTGGMLTKLEAAETARRSGTLVVIASGELPDVILRIAKGERVGTRIMPVVDTLESRKRYMLAGAGKGNAVIIDAGAKKALVSGGSLLPVGIKKVMGSFDRGAIITVMDEKDETISLGLANYASEDVKKIKGKQSDQIEKSLGYIIGDEVIHHNNMVLLI